MLRRLLLFLFSIPVFAQTSTTTPNIGLEIPAYGSTGWSVAMNYNFGKLDQLLSGNAALPALSVTGPVNLPQLQITPQQIQAAIGFTPLNPANNLSDIPNPSVALANLGGIGVSSYQGAWSSSTNYSRGQIVTYLGSSYISLVNPNIGNVPSTSPSSWGLFSGVGASFPSTSGIVFNTSPNASRNATASDLSGLLNGSGLLNVNSLAVSGTPSTSTFLRGDGTWGTPTGGGTITGVTAGQWLQGGGTSGVVPLSTTTQRGKHAKVDLGLDNTGTNDIGAILNSYCATYGASDTMPELFFPAGTYLITTPVNCQGSSTSLKQFTLIGEGRSGWGTNGSVTFNCNTPGQTCFWLNNSQTTSGSNRGPRIEHVTFNDVSSTHSDQALLRITQYNNIELNDIQFNNSTGLIYSAGTVAVTNGSTTVTGTGTSWISAMQWGRLQINGLFYEIASVQSATQLTLTSSFQGTTGTGLSYAIDYDGVGLMLEGDSATGFTQYGTISNIYAYNNMLAVDAVGGPTSASGTSRIKFIGGYVDCHRTPDSGAFWFGKFSDTMEWDVSANNCAVFGQIESGHAHIIHGEMENGGAFTPVTTCNGGTASQACTKGVVLSADAIATGHDNTILGGYIYDTGNAIEFDSPNVTTAYVMGSRLRSNLNNYVWADGSTGCSATNTAATVVMSDCTTFQALPSITLPADKLTSPSSSPFLDWDQYTWTVRYGQNASTTGDGLMLRDASTNTGTGTLFHVKTYSGTSGMQPVEIDSAASQWYISRTGNLTFQTATAATSSANNNSPGSALCGTDYTGSASEGNCYTFQNIVSSGNSGNAPSALKLTHSGASSGTTKLDFTSIGLVQFSTATEGRATLASGTATVSTTWASTSYNYQLTNCGVSGTPGILSVGTVTAGTSFVINSTSSSDNSTVCWSIH